MEYKYFEKPVRVKFWNINDYKWCIGLALEDMIIYSKGLKRFLIKEIYENAPRRIKEPIVICNNSVDECENEVIWINYI